MTLHNPLVSGLTIGAAYFVASWVPVLPYFFISRIPTALIVALSLAVVAMVLMGIEQA